MAKITGDDILKIALANPDVVVPPEALDTKAAKRNKYNAVKCEFDGLKFASKAEMARYGELRLLQMTGHIRDLKTQPVFHLAGKVRYIADFRYVENGCVIVEDVKGVETPAFRIKWKQVQELNPTIDFRIVKR